MAVNIPAGNQGVAATVQWIRTLVDRAVRSLDVNRLAIRILDEAHVPEYDTRAAAKAIYNWVRTNFRFVPDPIGYDDNWQPQGYETLRPIEELLQVRAGDCDDINSVLLASLLSSIGIVCRLVTVAADADQPGQFSHIYFEALIDGEWIAVDAARPGAKFGREPEWWTAKRIWGLDGGYVDVGEVPNMRGMNGLGRMVNLRGLGDDSDDDDSGSDIDYGAIIQQALTSAPQIVSAITGNPLTSTVARPLTAVSATGVATGLVSATPVGTAASASLALGISSSDILAIALIAGFFIMASR